jgi:hypothetical protein
LILLSLSDQGVCLSDGFELISPVEQVTALRAAEGEHFHVLHKARGITDLFEWPSGTITLKQQVFAIQWPIEALKEEGWPFPALG